MCFSNCFPRWSRIPVTTMPEKRIASLQRELHETQDTLIAALTRQLLETQDTLAAIRHGAADAIVVTDPAGEHHIYSLESSDRPFRVLVEQMQDGAVTLAQDGTLLYCNRRFAELLNVPHEQIVGCNLQSFLVDQEPPIVARMLLAAMDAPAREDFELRSPNGTTRPVTLSLSPLRRSGNISLLCGVINDLTQQQQHFYDMEAANARLRSEMSSRAEVEELLRHTQKLEAIGKLAAGVAHDFNNILQSVVSNLELALDDVPEGTETHDFAKVALQAAQRGASLTDYLLSYARKQRLTPASIAVGAFLDGMVKLLRSSLDPGITLEVKVPETLFVLVDVGQLQNAILNLAINASHAMPAGGMLTIEAQSNTEGKCVIISLTDTGIGMDAATLAQAAEPFYTTKGNGGSGLGLSMVQGFAAQSGGEFYITSALGRGTTTTLRLPAATPGVLVKPVRAVAVPRGGRILLVDDSEDVLVAVGAFLTKAGFIAVRAENGDEALAFLKASPGFDALITDYSMPGMNGLDLIIEARNFQPALPAILITGFAGFAGAKTIDDGTLVLHKPFQREELLTALQQVIDSNKRHEVERHSSRG
jgi:PAS domain S-box-containing protein